MILEELEGNVKVTFAGKTLSVGDSADDYSKGVLVIGTGKAIFRLDPSATFEVKGVETVVEEKPTTVPVSTPVPTPAPTPAPIPAPVPQVPIVE